MKKFKKSNKGITLIALVITIIILLILAGLTISSLTGSGLFQKAEYAKEKTIMGEEKEQITVAYLGCKTTKLGGKVTSSELQEEMLKNGQKVTVTGEDLLVVTYTETKNQYKVNENGEIEKNTPLTEEEANKIVDAMAVEGRICVVTAGGTVKLVNEELEEGLDLKEVVNLTNENTTIISDNGVRKKGNNFFVDNLGKVYTWGDNLGNGTGEYSNVPICISDIEGNILNGKNIIYMEEGIALDNQGKVYTWGDNYYGQLGNGSNENSNVPICISDIDGNALKGKSITYIYSDGWRIVALDDVGKVYTWGSNSRGELGNGSNEDSNVPICISDIEGSVLKGNKIIQVQGDSPMIALDNAGKVYTWGSNLYGELGNGKDGINEGSNIPICISDIEGNILKGKKIINVQCSYWEVKALDNTGKIYTWGHNSDGELGNGSNENSNVPICISDIEGNALKGKKITQLQYDDSGTLIVLDNEGKLYTWGYNENGRLGTGSEESSNVPICINDIEGNALNGKKITHVQFSSDTIIAIDNESKVYTWGQGSAGATMVGNSEDIYSPTCISDLSDNVLKGKAVKKVGNFWSDFRIIKYNNIVITEDGHCYYNFITQIAM